MTRTDVQAGTHNDVEPLPEPDADPIGQLSHIIPALWRVLGRATKAAGDLPTLESQVTILRKLDSAGPLPPARLAEELHLHRSTISNLIRDLVAQDMIRREPSELDGRSVLVVLTPLGRSVLGPFRRDRIKVLREALEALSPEQSSRLLSAIGDLRALVQVLEREASAAGR